MCARVAIWSDGARDANAKSGSAQIPSALAFARSAFGKRFSNREQNRQERFVAIAAYFVAMSYMPKGDSNAKPAGGRTAAVINLLMMTRMAVRESRDDEANADPPRN